MKICVIGDSISYQYGPYLRVLLCGIIECSKIMGEEEALLKFDNPWRTESWDSLKVLRFLRSKFESGGIEADFILMNCGLHDIKTNPKTREREIPIERYRDNLSAIVQVAARMRVGLIWIKTTPCDEKIHNLEHINFYRFSSDVAIYNQAADQIMAEAGVPSIDLHAFTLNLGSDLYCDHVHFHEHIREKQAAFIAGWLTAFKEFRIDQPVYSGNK